MFKCLGCPLAGVTYLRYTVLTSPNEGETAVHCCDPPLSVLVMLVSRNVFHVVSALQSIVWYSSALGTRRTGSKRGQAIGWWQSHVSIRHRTLSRRWHFAPLSPGRTDSWVSRATGRWKQERTSHSHHGFFGHDSHPEATVSPSRRKQLRSAARNDLWTLTDTFLFSRIALKRI